MATSNVKRSQKCEVDGTLGEHTLSKIRFESGFVE